MRAFAIGLHATTLALFWLSTQWPSRPGSELPAPPSSIDPPIFVELHFDAPEHLAPRALRSAAARRLRSELGVIADDDDATRGCKHTWRIRPSISSGDGRTRDDAKMASVQATVRLRHGDNGSCGDDGLALPFVMAASSSQVAACLLNASAPPTIPHGRIHRRSVSGPLLRGMARVLHAQLSSLSCSLERAPRAWRPPGRVSLLLVQRYRPPPTLAAARNASDTQAARASRLARLRAATQALLDAWWGPGTLAPQAHSQIAHFAHEEDEDGESAPASAPTSRGFHDGALPLSRAVDLVRSCAAGLPTCGSGVTPTLAPEPPLTIVMYALAPHEPAPPRLVRDVVRDATQPRDAGRRRAASSSSSSSSSSSRQAGQPLSDGSGVVVPGVGALLQWRDTSADGADDAVELMARGIASTLRALFGLPDVGAEADARANADDDTDGDTDASVHAIAIAAAHADARGIPPVARLDATVAQMSCARAHAADATLMLQRLPAFTHDFGGRSYGDVAAVAAMAAAAAAHLATSHAHASGGQYGLACEAAGRARADAEAATRHPSLLVTEGVPEDTWLTTWPPLFFPIATAVTSAAVQAGRRTLRARPRATTAARQGRAHAS